jgi:hypothetical protein
MPRCPKTVLTIFRQLAVIWALMRVLHTFKHLNWLDGRQLACRAAQVAESAVQSIMSVVQTDVAALGLQDTYISFRCSNNGNPSATTTEATASTWPMRRSCPCEKTPPQDVAD